MLEAHPEAQALKASLRDWLGKKRQAKVKDAPEEKEGSSIEPSL